MREDGSCSVLRTKPVSRVQHDSKKSPFVNRQSDQQFQSDIQGSYALNTILKIGSAMASVETANVGKFFIIEIGAVTGTTLAGRVRCRR